jgi:signal transduction histidine kinase/CheY-like chemotaxis protein/ligand-binding sensor domain-containing protein
MPRRAALALGLVLCAAGTAGAEDWTPVRAFRTFTRSTWRGLPQSTVTSLAQDANGVLWLGTFDGVATFDGRSLEPVPRQGDAPAGGVINAIAARRGGGVHVATPVGLHTFDGRRWTMRRAARSVAQLAVRADGTPWVADVDGAVWSADASGGWEKREEVRAAALALAAAPDGAVWVATRDAVLRNVGGFVERVGGAAPLPSAPAALLVARDGTGFVATSGGTLHWARPGDRMWHEVSIAGWSGARFRSLGEDLRGRVWAGSIDGPVAFGTVQGGFRSWDQQNGPFVNGVLAILGDREGHVWFGSNGGALSQWIGEPWSHRTSILGPQRPIDRFPSWGLTPTADGRLLVAGFTFGVLELRPDGTARNYAQDAGLTENARQVVEPEPGRWWVAGRYGIYESVDGGRFHPVLKLASGFAIGLYRSPAGRWYAGTSTEGVYEQDGTSWRPMPAVNAALDDPYVRSISWTREGEMWVGTLRGASVFRGGQPVERLSRPTVPAMPESVNAVLQAQDGAMWLGGIGGLAVRRGGQWQGMTERDGLPGNTIYSIVQAPDGAVWVGGAAGVGRFQHGAWTTWDSRSGLLEDECNLHGLTVTPAGHVYVATMGSIAHFDPTVTPLPPPPLELLWRTRPEGDRVTDRALRLSWSAAWLGPQGVEYRVRVPRLRAEWSAPTPDAQIAIENLAAGSWTVEVQGRVVGTPAWSEPLVLELQVPPLWHETTAARLGGAALLVLAGLAIARLRTRRLQQKARELQAEVQARTTELAERVEQLRESEQRAQQASHAKSAFLANMSHELRTPLNGVLGFCQLMSRRPGRDAEDRRNFGIILKSGEHLLGLINDVLSLARIESGGASVHSARFDPSALVLGVVEMVRPRAEAKGLELRVESGARLPDEVVGDAGKLRQVLLNLLANAVKFTERGAVTLRTRWASEIASFAVEDTGVGIAADEMKGLFEPFVQTASGRQAREGAGLGLALSRELARAMGGEITVRSEPGRGSVFTLDLPLVLPVVEDGSTASGAQTRVARVAPGQETWRILVVDDVPHNLELLATLLRAVGFSVREASTGEEALDTWREWQPHLIWLDKRMPGIDGSEALRRIRAEERERPGDRPVKIVVHSASALAHEQEEMLRTGADGFVAKPFRESTVYETVAALLGVRYEHEEVAPAAEPPPALRARGGRRVLGVDDETINRRVARLMLRTMGLDVVEAASGEEAIARLQREPVDAVLLDVEMPGMSGFDIAREIRSRSEWRHIPIIAATGHVGEEGRRRCLTGGMDDHVSKPLDPDDLRATLARHMED